MADPISPTDFGASFKGFMEQMARQTPPEEPYFRRRLLEHFGSDPAKLAIVTQKFSDADLPNVHLAVEAYTLAPERSCELLGISSDAPAFMGISFAQLISPGGMMRGASATEGPVTYANVALDGDRVLACTSLGMYLVREGNSSQTRQASCSG